MRWPLLVIAALAVTLAATAAVSLHGAADLSSRINHIYASETGGQPMTQKQQDEAGALSRQAQGLEQLITPLSTGSLVCGLGILLVLGRRWQLRPETCDSPLAAEEKAR
jgi:hypothetical protein